MTAVPDEAEIEAIQARARAEYLGCYNDEVFVDVDALLAALEDERGGTIRHACATCGCAVWMRKQYASVTCGVCTCRALEHERDNAYRTAIEAAIKVAQQCRSGAREDAPAWVGCRDGIIAGLHALIDAKPFVQRVAETEAERVGCGLVCKGGSEKRRCDCAGPAECRFPDARARRGWEP